MVCRYVDRKTKICETDKRRNARHISRHAQRNVDRRRTSIILRALEDLGRVSTTTNDDNENVELSLPMETVYALRNHFILSISLCESLQSEEAEIALVDIIRHCWKVAPYLIEDKSALLPLARIAAFVKPSEYMRPLSEWHPNVDMEKDGESHVEIGQTDSTQSKEACVISSRSSNLIISLMQHLLQRYEVPFALSRAILFTDASGESGFYGLGQGWRCSEEASQLSWSFFKVYKAVAKGDSARDAMKTEISNTLTNKMIARFVSLDANVDEEDDNDDGSASSQLPMKNDDIRENGRNPLHTLRSVQLEAYGAEDWILQAVKASRCGKTLDKSHEMEEFVQNSLQWICSHQDDISEPKRVTAMLDYFCEMRKINPKYSCFGRTTKTVMEGLEEFQLSTVTFEDDEQFETNPEGIQGLYEVNISIPAGTKVSVPYEGVTTFDGDLPSFTVRVAEILSLKRLIYEGEQLGNCLKDNRRSQVKYVSRVRQRVSSFWSMTFIINDCVHFQCLIEVWHLRQGNVIHQAEGPRPRTIPTPIAWYFLDMWCKKQNLDLSAWDCYS